MITALLAHLTRACPSFASLEDASRLSDLERSAYPYATLTLAREQVADLPLCGAGTVTQQWAVIATVRGGAALAPARAELKAAMRTFTDPALLRGPAFQGGALLQVQGALLQWRDLWELVVADS